MKIVADKIADDPCGKIGCRFNDSTLRRITWRSRIDTTREKLGNPTDLQLLQKTFDRMK